jgi:hypothetical protein
MHLRLASICLSLTLMISAAPAFSHSGHTSIFHSHSGIEYFLVLCVIGGIIYRHLKN